MTLPIARCSSREPLATSVRPSRRSSRERGANLVVMDLNGEALTKAYGTWAQTLAAPANLLEQSQVDAAVERVLARFGRIDVLVNLAGGFRMGEPVHATSEATWNFMLDLNARSLLHAVHAVVPHMLAGGGGKIVNVGAFSAQRGAAQMGAVHRLEERGDPPDRDDGRRAARAEHQRQLRAADDHRHAAEPRLDAQRRPGEVGRPEDLAKVIAFLASDAARAVHGAALPVTGLS